MCQQLTRSSGSHFFFIHIRETSGREKENSKFPIYTFRTRRSVNAFSKNPKGIIFFYLAVWICRYTGIVETVNQSGRRFDRFNKKQIIASIQRAYKCTSHSRVYIHRGLNVIVKLPRHINKLMTCVLLCGLIILSHQ